MADIDKAYSGVWVFVEQLEGKLATVTLELIGEAKKLASSLNVQVSAVLLGDKVDEILPTLLEYGADTVYIIDNPVFHFYRAETYRSAFCYLVEKYKPEILLMGATTTGRDLAGAVATTLKTGLTADCTALDIDLEKKVLLASRPAFGGNIMAQIKTPNTRPQMATVRYKVMNAIPRNEEVNGEIIICEMEASKLRSNIEVLSVRLKEKEESISDAETIIAIGRGVKSEKDLVMVRELADLLGAQIAGTRPMVESGWLDAKKQIGLSGRTVKPRLIITLGVSGAVQFAAGMNGSDYIFAVNNDEKASIFNVAHYGIVGDLYEVLPELIERIKLAKEA